MSIYFQMLMPLSLFSVKMNCFGSVCVILWFSLFLIFPDHSSAVSYMINNSGVLGLCVTRESWWNSRGGGYLKKNEVMFVCLPVWWNGDSKSKRENRYTKRRSNIFCMSECVAWKNVNFLKYKSIIKQWDFESCLFSPSTISMHDFYTQRGKKEPCIIKECNNLIKTWTVRTEI